MTTQSNPLCVFDAGDVGLMVDSILRRPNLRSALRAAARSAHNADVDADVVESLDFDYSRAAYYRDYARAMRLAIRIAAWQAYSPRRDRRTGERQPRLDPAEIKAHIDLVSYVDKHVRLVKAGHDRFVGLCPFHDDHSPSMSVWSDGRWKCFACGAGGDVFAFVMRWHECGFKDALHILSGGA